MYGGGELITRLEILKSLLHWIQIVKYEAIFCLNWKV